MTRPFFYYATSFISGYITLSLELLGFRLFAPYFGYSLYVFGSLVGLILFALATGYWLGGYFADKGVREQTFFKMTLLSGIYLTVVGIFSPPILDLLAQLHIIIGTLLATALFFAIPMAILAALSPYFIKTLSANQTVGISSGSIYAVGTIGSLFGTFLTSFYVIPTFGAFAALFSSGAMMICLSILWIVRHKGARLLAVALTLIVLYFLYLFSSPSRANTNVLAKKDSPYNHLEIVDYGEFLGLRTDRRNNLVYSAYSKNGIWDYRMTLYTLFALPPLINNAKTSLLLGLGAGTLPLLHQTINPGLKITGIEIDPEIVHLGREYFALDKIKNLAVVIEDARPFLARTHNLYDFVEIDLFWGGGEIPFYLASQEFFDLVSKHLSPSGIVAMNIYDPSEAEIVLAPLINTIRSVYPYVYRTKAPRGSHFVLASNKPIDYQGFNTKSYGPDLLSTIAYFKQNTLSVEFDKNTPIFTDDWTPIEKLSYQAIFSDP